MIDGGEPYDHRRELRWKPIRIALSQRHESVRLLDCGGDAFSEPFLFQTVERLRAGYPPPMERDMPLPKLLEVAGRLPAVVPSGLIFHVSRCGSTLLGNALRVDDSCRVISEAQPVMCAMTPYLQVAWPFAFAQDREYRKHTLASIATLYGTDERLSAKLVIKFTSWNLIDAAIVREVWPNVPIVVLIRDPTEVMVSLLNDPPSDIRCFRSAAAAAEAFSWTDINPHCAMSREEYTGRVVGSLLSKVCVLGGQATCRIVDYSQLSEDTVRGIGRFFGMELASGEPLKRVLGKYSKDASPCRAFVPDTARKQQGASSSVRAAAETWAFEPYYALHRYVEPHVSGLPH